MNTNTFQVQNQKKIQEKPYFGVKKLVLLIFGTVGLSMSIFASTYTANVTGKYNEEQIWVPSYPGNIINEEDTVYINNHVKLSTDIVIKGTVIVRRTGSLMGEKNIIILPTGSFINFGIAIMDALTNRGLVFNKHILEVAMDFINSGDLMNQESMVVGNIIDNVGMVTGNGGNLMANKKIVNSQTGSIQGNIDICSNKFMNVDGGTLDSINLSFCGHRIFGNMMLSADLRKESVVISLLNSETSQYKEYKVERSIDGINYETIASIKNGSVSDTSATIRYIDKEAIRSNSVFYRMRLTTLDNREKLIPPVELGNMLVSDIDASQF